MIYDGHEISSNLILDLSVRPRMTLESSGGELRLDDCRELFSKKPRLQYLSSNSRYSIGSAVVKVIEAIYRELSGQIS